ncbi:hypothetical protein FD14_GL000036 [Secundilactobacillus similis DSM 23365 = JCM 2765]|uniref:Uncharacterized protein n=2 Tax=Secundilactobacillus similis TaxID=414682 RepID=A0A0R2FQQ5_9LACO|nr:hypothetical protein FD14_GL000036 [Secundilactobacillus similis DSM 23365 = JCM 2765]
MLGVAVTGSAKLIAKGVVKGVKYATSEEAQERLIKASDNFQDKQERTRTKIDHAADIYSNFSDNQIRQEIRKVQQGADLSIPKQYALKQEASSRGII